MAKRKKKKRKTRESAESAVRSSPEQTQRSSAERGQFQRFFDENRDLLGAAAMALFFVAHLFGTDEFFLGSGTDIISLQYPVHQYAVKWMRQGVLPLWNPFVFGGVPFQAGVHGYLYPGLWTGLLFPSGFDIKLGIAIHLILAAVGGAWFARGHARSAISRIVCGQIFALSGFMTMHLFAGHRIMVMTAAYLPFVAGSLWRLRQGESRYLIRGAFAAGLMMLAGHYQIIFIGILGIFLWLLFEELFKEKGYVSHPLEQRIRYFGVCGGVILLGIGIAAVQIGPVIANLGLSQRPGDDAAFAASFSSAPVNLLTYLFPHFFGNKVDAPFIGNWAYWESLGYFGVVPLLLFGIGHGVLPFRRVLPKTIVAVLALILALGDHTPVFDTYLSLVPGADLFRSPGRYCVLVGLFAGLVAAQVLDTIVFEEVRSHRLSKLAMSTLAPILFLLVASAWFLSWQASDFSSWWEGLSKRNAHLSDDVVTSLLTLVGNDIKLALLFCLLLVGCIAAARRRPGLGRILGGVIAIAIFADLYNFGHRFLKTGDPSLFDFPEAFESVIDREEKPGLRIIPPAETRYTNFPMISSVGTPGGYDIFLEKRYAEYLNRANGRPADTFISYARTRRGSLLLRHLGFRYLLTSQRLVDGRNRFISGFGWLNPAGTVNGYQLYKDDNPTPRAFLVHRIVTEPDGEKRIRMLSKSAFDIEKEVVLDAPHSAFQPQPPSEGGREQVEIVALAPNSVDISVTAASNAVLVMSDTLMPGWKARVDGAPVPMVHANHVMRALPLRKGKHIVEMTYLPTGFVAGGVISIVTILLLLVCIRYTRRFSVGG